ncbi:patatin-like phospholipase family protein [Pelosinus propionicus]|uniref:NTE family protein n=1 Tax=Pelosinus propionicus DSM 13327 TaxID=1123291 RepID=A0A1I4PF10_9FIRM|nr:patatin-like phospholipase family protein [Pelosinus propionicus]SFM26003.1 NTE family protein [Pelosinus propionicus DSM 13327]
MDYPFRNFIFEGGGVKGISYIGALSVLQEKKVLPKIERVGGVSAGAVMALLMGLNFSFAEIEEILQNLDFTKFLDDSLGVALDTTRLFKEFGWYKGDFFRSWVGDLIQSKTGNPDATFKEVFEVGKKLAFKEMFFIGTNLSTRSSEVFSLEHTPDLCVADAVRISMSIPLLFAARRGECNDVYVDGGILDNYPIKLFDRKKYVHQHFSEPKYYQKFNIQLKESDKVADLCVFNKETLGFRLDSGREIAMFRELSDPVRKEIKDLIEFTKGLADIYMESQQNQHLHTDDWHRTMYIDTLHVKTTEFHLSDEKKKALIQSGRECAERYFKWYDDPANAVYNRTI